MQTNRGAAKTLDQYYVSARYPDALAAGAPHEVFTKKQAEEALAFAEEFVGHGREYFVEADP